VKHVLKRVALLVCLCGSAWPQENSGRILGTVTDSSGAVIGGAKIVASSPRTPKGEETTSDSLGNYVLANLPIGTYTVTVTFQGLVLPKKPASK